MKKFLAFVSMFLLLIPLLCFAENGVIIQYSDFMSNYENSAFSISLSEKLTIGNLVKSDDYDLTSIDIGDFAKVIFTMNIGTKDVTSAFIYTTIEKATQQSRKMVDAFSCFLCGMGVSNSPSDSWKILKATGMFDAGGLDKWAIGSYKIGNIRIAYSVSSSEVKVMVDLENKNEKVQAEKSPAKDSEPTYIASTATSGESSALKSAMQYLSIMQFSRSGLIEQLEYSGYTNKDATYAADNCNANWNEQAAKKALSYLEITPFSYTGLIEQLEYEGYTKDQATYGADQSNADWNEQAAKKAKSYLEMMSFSKKGLIEQLEYEGYTKSEAEYGAKKNGY